MKKLNPVSTIEKTNQDETQEERIKRSDALKAEAAKDINKRYRNGTLWVKGKKKS